MVKELLLVGLIYAGCANIEHKTVISPNGDLRVRTVINTNGDLRVSGIIYDEMFSLARLAIDCGDKNIERTVDDRLMHVVLANEISPGYNEGDVILRYEALDDDINEGDRMYIQTPHFKNHKPQWFNFRVGDQFSNPDSWYGLVKVADYLDRYRSLLQCEDKKNIPTKKPTRELPFSKRNRFPV
jgi:hypothetical protein